MSDSLSLLGKASLEEGNAVGRRVIFNLGGSFLVKTRVIWAKKKRITLPRCRTSHFA